MKKGQLRNAVLGIIVVGSVGLGLGLLVAKLQSGRGGSHKAYYPGGKVREEVTFKDGKPQGERKIFDENGKLKQKNTYRDGKLSGPCKTYFENGRVAGDFILKDGVPEGSYKFYYESGRLREEGVYKDGQSVKSKIYNQDGSVFSIQKKAELSDRDK